MLRIIVLSLMAATAAFSRTLTIDDILSLRRLPAVQISPDGSNVGYLVEEPNDELHSKDPILSTLWVVPAAQPASRLIVKGLIRTPQWAPDSRSISYIMDGQIYVASLAGGEPRAIRIDLGYDALDLEVSDTVVTRSPSRVWIADVKTGRSEMVRTGSRHILGVSWSPDGSMLLLMTASRPVNDERTLAAAPRDGFHRSSPEECQVRYNHFLV